MRFPLHSANRLLAQLCTIGIFFTTVTAQDPQAPFPVTSAVNDPAIAGRRR